MRDIRPEGNLVINGDFTVNESSRNEFIPFEKMNVEQLQYLLKHHQKLAKEERTRINKISFGLLGIALVLPWPWHYGISLMMAYIMLRFSSNCLISVSP